MLLALLGLAGGIAVLSFFTKAMPNRRSCSRTAQSAPTDRTQQNPSGSPKAPECRRGRLCAGALGVVEAGNLPAEAQLAVMWATRNHSVARGISIPGVLLHANGTGRGYFGKQDQGRYAATSQDSTSTSRALATAVALGVGTDPTGGAQQWDSPQSFTDWNGSSSAKADEVAAARVAAGNALVTLPGDRRDQDSVLEAARVMSARDTRMGAVPEKVVLAVLESDQHHFLREQADPDAAPRPLSEARPAPRSNTSAWRRQRPPRRWRA